MEYFKSEFLEVKQPIGKFYIISLRWDQLISIAEADIRRIQKEEENQNSFDSYLGIQREVSAKRINEIQEYVRNVDATFPTSIILHIRSKTYLVNNQEVDPEKFNFIDLGKSDVVTEIKNIEIDNENRNLLIRADEKVARILDGQHRIEGIRVGFKNIDHENKDNFQLNVTVFIDLDIDEQAQIFSIINKAQTKVNKSLVYDLFEYAKSRSPQKTAHDIVRILNKLSGSPFYKKIKILGTARDSNIETLAQATFVELILGYLSDNPMQDRDRLKRKTLFGSLKIDLEMSDEIAAKRIFRKWFLDEKDEEIYKFLNDYFLIIATKWPLAWRMNFDDVASETIIPDTIPGSIIDKTTGIIAFMRLLKPLSKQVDFSSKDRIEKLILLFDKIKISDFDFNKEKYIPGSSGQSSLYNDLITQIGI